MATESQTAQDALPGKGEENLASDAVPTPEAVLVRAPANLLNERDSRVLDSAVSRIPIEIDVAVPVKGFRVRNLLALAVGDVIASQWLHCDDLPLGGRGAQLAWAEFEVIDEKLAVRITRLL